VLAATQAVICLPAVFMETMLSGRMSTCKRKWHTTRCMAASPLTHIHGTAQWGYGIFLYGTIIQCYKYEKIKFKKCLLPFSSIFYLPHALPKNLD
jgi:hypothetical protein